MQLWILLCLFALFSASQSAAPTKLDKELAAQRDLLGDINKKQNDLNSEIRELKAGIIKPLQEELAKLSAIAKGLSRKRIGGFRAGATQSTTNCAFYAHRVMPYKNTESIIPYDSVLLDTGNNLNPSTGVFKAPVKGIYFFTFSAMKQWGIPHLAIRLLHNNGIVTSKLVSSGNYFENSGDNWTPIDMQATLPLQAGDTVAMYLQGGILYDSRNPTANRNIGKVTTFSGFLVQEQF